MITNISTTANDLQTPKFIQFDYGVRGFYCPNCYIGTSLNNDFCRYCGQKLKNPYEETFKDEVSKENN